MKILFVKDHGNIGRRGEIKEVSDGMARNLLIPKGIAVVATSQLSATIAREKADAEAKKDRKIEKSKNLKADIEKKTFTVKVNVGDKGQIFGGVHEKDIISVVNEKMGTAFNKVDLKLSENIRTTGNYKAVLKLAHGTVANIQINIEAR